MWLIRAVPHSKGLGLLDRTIVTGQDYRGDFSDVIFIYIGVVVKSSTTFEGGWKRLLASSAIEIERYLALVCLDHACGIPIYGHLTMCYTHIWSYGPLCCRERYQALTLTISLALQLE